MEMTSLAEYDPQPGELIEFRVTESSSDIAAKAAVHPAPLSHLQENHVRRRLANDRAGNPQAPWLGVHFDLPGRLDATAMATALAEWVRRHTTLLTWFAARGDGFERHAVAPDSVGFVPESRGDLSGQAVRDFLQVRLVPATDPTRWPPLLACAVVRDMSSTVILAIDHAHTDGLSLQAAFSELTACYEGRGARLPEVGSYVDFCRLDRERSARLDAGSPEVARWADFLRAGLPLGPVELGVEPGRMYRTTAIGLDVFEPAEADAFGRACKTAGVGFSAGMLAALAVTGHRLSGQETYRALVTVHTRDEPRWERAHGWFINTVPVELPATGETFERVLEGAGEALARAGELRALTPMRLAELLPDHHIAHLGTTQTPPLVSYLDLRHAPAARDFASSNVGFLTGEGRAQGLHLWLNRTWERTYLRIDHPDTPTARTTVPHFAKLLRSTLRELAGAGAGET
ncbi:condensation domain-containing protein [Streptomyces sp. NPDC047072]|uniref:condensation domain-containing protein n=1 Tax=Streptomyces sp. NPDC047072 TaxID=3154809 RepID=UPI0033FBFEFC